MTKKGFTLVELMIVIAIIGILSAALYPQLGRYIERSKTVSLNATISELRKIAELYKIDHDNYPIVACENRYPVGDSRNCEADEDPFVPYNGGIYNRVTPWGGEIAYGFVALWGGPAGDSYFLLNDDSRYTLNDNMAIMPGYILEIVDNQLDDGNLGTGSFMGNAMSGSYTGTGEGLVMIEVN